MVNPQMDKEEKPDQKELANKVLDIFSDRPEDMAALIETLKKLEKNPVLHPEKTEADKKESDDKDSKEKDK